MLPPTRSRHRAPPARDEPGTAIVCCCTDCGMAQRIPVDLSPLKVAKCARCARRLRVAGSRSVSSSLAIAITLLALLIPANLFPMMRAELRGEPRVAHIGTATAGLWEEGWPLVAVIFGLFTLVLPLLYAGLLVVVLTAVRMGRHDRWVAHCFRISDSLRVWAMPEVLIIAGLVVFIQLREQIDADITKGGMFIIAAGITSIVSKYYVDRTLIWHRIMPQPQTLPEGPQIACVKCGMLVCERAIGTRCPRCGHLLRGQKAESVSLTTAFILAGLVLYPASLAYPILCIVRATEINCRNIPGGIAEIWNRGFWYLAVIVAIASIMIPLLKLVGLSWLSWRVRRPRRRFIHLRTRVHRLIDRIGRWSNVDPFIVAINIPLMSYIGLADTRPEPAMLMFLLVVVLTMFASRCFDSRLMWSGLEGRT